MVDFWQDISRKEFCLNYFREQVDLFYFFWKEIK